MAAITGPEVVSTGVTGGFLPAIGETILGGIRGFIDVEIAQRTGSAPDQADIKQAVAEALKDANKSQAAGIGGLEKYGVPALMVAAFIGFAVFMARG